MSKEIKMRDALLLLLASFLKKTYYVYIDKLLLHLLHSERPKTDALVTQNTNHMKKDTKDINKFNYLVSRF